MLRAREMRRGELDFMQCGATAAHWNYKATPRRGLSCRSELDQEARGTRYARYLAFRMDATTRHPTITVEARQLPPS